MKFDPLRIVRVDYYLTLTCWSSSECKDSSWQCDAINCDAQCSVVGNGHYNSFDKRAFTYPDIDCGHTLARECSTQQKWKVTGWVLSTQSLLLANSYSDTSQTRPIPLGSRTLLLGLLQGSNFKIEVQNAYLSTVPCNIFFLVNISHKTKLPDTPKLTQLNWRLSPWQWSDSRCQ